MSPKTKYLVGSVLLFVAAVILIVQLLGMAGITRKLAPSRELNLTAIVLVVAAAGLRRRARKEMNGTP